MHDTKIYNLYEGTPQSANFLSDFDVFDYQAQLSTACSAFHSKMKELGESGSDKYACWIDDFKEWALATNETHVFPFKERFAFANATIKWLNDWDGAPYSYENRSDYYWNKKEESYSWLTGFAYTSHGSKDPAKRMHFTFATFETSLDILPEDGHPNDVLWELYDKMETCLGAARDASGIENGIQTCEDYEMMALASYLEVSFPRQLVFGPILAARNTEPLFNCPTSVFHLTVLGVQLIGRLPRDRSCSNFSGYENEYSSHPHCLGNPLRDCLFCLRGDGNFWLVDQPFGGNRHFDRRRHERRLPTALGNCHCPFPLPWCLCVLLFLHFHFPLFSKYPMSLSLL